MRSWCHVLHREGCRATIDPTSWDVPPLFHLLQEGGAIDWEEMRQVFNLGVGFIAVLPPGAVMAAQSAAAAAGADTWIMGEISRGPRDVRFAR